MDKRICIKCLKIITLDKFSKDTGCKLGYRPISNKCDNETIH